MCHPVHVAGALIIEEPELHADMYCRVIPSQIIMLYATMSCDFKQFYYELFNNNNNLGNLMIENAKQLLAHSFTAITLEF